MVIWELTGTGEARQKKALAADFPTAFFALALYILVQSARTLYLHIRPETSPLGVLWLAVTFAAMVRALPAGQARHRNGAQ